MNKLSLDEEGRGKRKEAEERREGGVRTHGQRLSGWEWVVQRRTHVWGVWGVSIRITAV